MERNRDRPVDAYRVASMFSVYLIHSSDHAWKYLAYVQDWLLAHGAPLAVAYLGTALAVFSVCLVLDTPRRLAALAFGKSK